MQRDGSRSANYISLWDYFRTCFVPFLGLSIPLKPCHRVICDTLQAAFLGQLKQKIIVINIAPRIGKTKLLEAFQCWSAAYFPESHFINTSYSAPLAEASTRFVKLCLSSQWSRVTFPWFRFGDIEKNSEFTTYRNGHFYGTGVTGTITGFGAGMKRPAGGAIIIDDPANPTEALSAVMSEYLQFWFENTILRRRNSSEHTPVIIVAQRLAVNDLPGYVLENYADEVLHLEFPVMVNGESQFPETITTAAAVKTLALNPFAYWAQLQQKPIVLGGNLIKTDDFFSFKLADVGGMRWESKIITCDTALKTEEHNDWSVIQLWGKKDSKAYLLDQARGKWESPELLTNFRAFYYKHHALESPVTRVTIEDKAAGTGAGQQLVREGIPIEPIPRNKDKVTRVMEILPYIVTHMVGIPSDAPFTPALLSECAQFRKDGKTKTDDQVDTLCDGVWFSLGKPLSIFDVLG